MINPHLLEFTGECLYVLDPKEPGSRYAGVREYGPKFMQVTEIQMATKRKAWRKSSIGRMPGESQQ